MTAPNAWTVATWNGLVAKEASDGILVDESWLASAQCIVDSLGNAPSADHRLTMRGYADVGRHESQNDLRTWSGKTCTWLDLSSTAHVANPRRRFRTQQVARDGTDNRTTNYATLDFVEPIE